MKSSLVFLLLAISAVSHAKVGDTSLEDVLNLNTGVSQGKISGTGNSCSLGIRVEVPGCDDDPTYHVEYELGGSGSLDSNHLIWQMEPTENTISVCDSSNPEACTLLSFDSLNKKILNFTVQDSKESILRCDLDPGIKGR